jgi:3-isopropylmalate/(R)-2-methylmalate dehydratase small subunit
LLDYGFRAVVAPSFADIFANNCSKNGILPVVLDTGVVEKLFGEVSATPDYRLEVDLELQQIVTPGGEKFLFEIDAFRKQCLLEGLDEISLTLQHADAIREFEERRREQEPWLF